MTQEVTDWFGGHVKPFRKGVYERLVGESTFFSNWDGKHWGTLELSIYAADVYKDSKSLAQSTPWRGLANEPNSLV